MAVSYWPYIAPFVGEKAGENKCIVIRTYTMRHSADVSAVCVHPETRVARMSYRWYSNSAFCWCVTLYLALRRERGLLTVCRLGEYGLKKEEMTERHGKHHSDRLPV